MGNIFFLRGPPTTTSCTRSSERCAGSSSAWHSSFQLVSGFFLKKSKIIFLARVCGGKQCVRRPHFYALLIFPSSSISLPRPASSQPLPPSVAGRGGMSFFLGGLTQNKRGGSRNLVHKQVSFLLSKSGMASSSAIVLRMPAIPMRKAQGGRHRSCKTLRKVSDIKRSRGGKQRTPLN